MLKIGVFTDMQYADAESVGKRDYRASITKFLDTLGYFESVGVDAVFHLGDAFDHDWSNLTAVSELFRTIRKPFYNLLGNHDFLVPDEKKNLICEYLCLPEARGYYSVSIPDSESGQIWRFLFLNGNEISTYAAQNDQERKVAETVRETFRLENGNLPESFNGAMTQDQLNWIDCELSDAKTKGEFVILCNHFPIFSKGGSLSISDVLPFADIVPVYYAKMGYSQWNAEELFTLMDRYPGLIKGYWAGHLHEGAYGVRKGVPHITFKGMVETKMNSGVLMILHDGKAEIAENI